MKINKLFIAVLMTLCMHQVYAQKFISSHTVGEATKAYSKILVVVKTKDHGHRLEMEDDLVKTFKKKDIQAVPSYIRLTDEMLKNKKPDEAMLEKLVKTLRENGFDGILVTTLVDAKQSVEFNPSQYRSTNVPLRYGRFGRYYGSARVGVYEPGSVEKHQNFVLETLLYDLRGSTKDNSLHWMGKIEITDPVSFDKTSEKYARTLVKKLTKEAID